MKSIYDLQQVFSSKIAVNREQFELIKLLVEEFGLTYDSLKFDRDWNDTYEISIEEKITDVYKVYIATKNGKVGIKVINVEMDEPISINLILNVVDYYQTFFAVQRLIYDNTDFEKEETEESDMPFSTDTV